MAFWQMVGRLLLNFSANPLVQDALRKAGNYAIRQGTAALVRAVRNRNPKVETETYR